jgi:S-adenosylmethionine hydrolase
MSIVTLISDLGLKDHYVSLVKARLLNANPTCIPVDVSHVVGTGQVDHAAFLLRSIWNDFPYGTVHMNGVDSYLDKGTSHLVVEYQNRFVITADNGLMPMAFPSVDRSEMLIHEIHLPNTDSTQFPMSGIMSEAAARISRGDTLEGWTVLRADFIKDTKGLQPYYNGTQLLVQVFYIDHFGNLYFNISKDEFDYYSKGRSFAIQLKANTSINKFHNSFSDVKLGSEVAMWGQNNLLIATMNLDQGGEKAGNLSRLMKLNLGDTVTIDFHGDPNS